MTRDLLLRILDEAYDRKAWHGPNLRAAIHGLTPNQAFWRPAEEAHNTWDLVLHCAYWKFVVWRRLTGVRGVKFPREGRNFFATPEPTPRAWREDVRVLDDAHHTLRDAIERMPERALATRMRLVYGAAMHDVYHAGQIRLLRRLYED